MQETERLEALSAPKDYRLRVVDGPDAGKTISVHDRISIGTSEHCDFVLDDRSVSRRHCLVEARAQGLAVQDQSSRNGTFVSGTRIFSAELPEDAVLLVGRTRLRVEIDSDATPSDVPTGHISSFGGFIGRARALQPMYRALSKASPSEVTVVLEGESGTGKEVLAEAIHAASARRDGPFVVVDFAAMPESLIEAELLGHERGAFTGAEQRRAGAFEQAHGGTIFLDEIGELPAALQTRLLGVLERRSFRRVGGSENISVDVRVVAATNRNLEAEVEEGRFRLDLFHRLAVALIHVPPVRERREDIEQLARHFSKQMNQSLRLDDEALGRMLTHDWPGNVRELRNYVERLAVFGQDEAVLFRQGTTVDTQSLDKWATQSVTSGVSYRKARAELNDRFKEAYVEASLAHYEGDVAKAAEAAGVARRHFNRMRNG